MSLFCLLAALELSESVALVNLHNSTVYCESVVRDVAGNSSACGCVYCLAQLDRCNEIGVASDKAVVTDNTAALGDTIVVYSNCSTADIDLLADVTVADISQMSDSGLFTDSGVFDLYEVSDMYAGLDMAVRTDVYVRANGNIAVDN